AVPGRVIGRGVTLGPVARGEVRRDVFGVAAKFEDVPLRNAQVLQQPPGRVRDAGRPGAAQRGRQVGDGRVEVQVGAAAAEQVQKVFAQGLVGVHRVSSRS